MYGYRPTTRLLSMLELLQARGRMGGPELARRLEVGERTVRRYVAMLQEMGVPVEAERGRYGAYSLRPGFTLPPMMFTDEEAIALALGLLSARRLGLSGAAPAVEGAQAKLERVMPEGLRDRVRTFEEVVVPAAVAPARLPAGDIVVTVSAAVRERRRVKMRYRSGTSEETERVVDPYVVVQGDAFWYTLGYCHLRRGIRLFRLDRVLAVERIDEKFELPPGFDTPQGVLDALADMREDRWSVEVLLETTVGEASGQLPKMGVSLQETPEGVVMRSSTSDLGWMARVLAGLSFPFVVRRPSELRQSLRRLAAEVAALAERTEDPGHQEAGKGAI
ncbi:MAG TPA: YafY family protein [Rubrobacter sp.]|nr:YafY family protein [Rubrobacter sp.]